MCQNVHPCQQILEMECTSQGGNQLSDTRGLLVGQHHLEVATSYKEAPEI